MRKLSILFCLLGLAFSCSDGDLEIEAIDFDEGSILFCNDGGEDTETTLFFKILEDEVLILNLQSNLIENAPSDGILSSSIGSGSTLTYRLFSDNVTQAYFCDDIPPATPTVTEEIVATSGQVDIVSTLDTVSRTTKTYLHDFTISELTLTNSLGESITDQTGIDFGEYTTSLDSSVALVFSNYENVDIGSCEVTGETITMIKILNDEYLTLTIPLNLIPNEVTGDTPRELSLSGSIVFNNGIARNVVTTDNVCNGISASELENNFSTTEGTVSVSTVASEPDSEGIITYTHTISLVDFALQDANGANVGTLESYVFGEFATTSN